MTATEKGQQGAEALVAAMAKVREIATGLGSPDAYICDGIANLLVQGVPLDALAALGEPERIEFSGNYWHRVVVKVGDRAVEFTTDHFPIEPAVTP